MEALGGDPSQACVPRQASPSVGTKGMLTSSGNHSLPIPEEAIAGRVLCGTGTGLSVSEKPRSDSGVPAQIESLAVRVEKVLRGASPNLFIMRKGKLRPIAGKASVQSF